MTKAIDHSNLAGSTAIPSGAAAGALLTEADAAAIAKAAFEKALKRFETYGRDAARGAGVVTAMAFDFADMCRDGVAKEADADALYKAHVDAFNANVRDDMDALEPKGYAQSLSIFKTFGLPYAVALGARSLYAEVAAYRKALSSKDGVDSNYSCYVKLNRRLNDGTKKDGADAMADMLADAAKRAAFIASIVDPANAAAKDEFAKAKVLADGIARLGKKSEHALSDDWNALAKVVADQADFLKARSERRKLENAALLIRKVA